MRGAHELLITLTMQMKVTATIAEMFISSVKTTIVIEI